jgi:AraC-like DNA-binding protein
MNHFSLRVFNAGDPTFLLIAPLLSFYIDELTGRRVKFSIKALAHLIPFFSIVFCSTSFNSLAVSNSFIKIFAFHPKLSIVIFWLIVVIQFIGYQIYIQRKWRAYQAVMRQEVSNTENINISWVNFFMAVFMIIDIFFLFALFVVIHLDYAMLLWKLAGIVFALSVFALGYKGILQREIFYTDDIRSVDLPTPTVPTKPDQQLIDKLTTHIIEKKSYLDSELTLSSLAKEINMSRTQLSQLINVGLGENFYDFINKYRVEEVKRLMTDPQVKNFNLLGIALEAGFKSKSTFNLIFKRFTGLTPTEYRKNLSS